MKPELVQLLSAQLKSLGAGFGAPQVGGFSESLGPELVAWSAAVTAPLELAEHTLVPPKAVGLTETVQAKDDGYLVARFRSLFAGLSPVVEGDERVVLASWLPLEGGSSQTYQAAQDEWGLAKFKPSIGGALAAVQTDPDEAFASAFAEFDKIASKKKFEADIDPAALWKATDWLVALVLSIAVDDLAAQLKKALPFKAWESSKQRIPAAPHLANYWLLAHWAFGNDEALAETLELSRGIEHPATAEIRRIAEGEDTTFSHQRVTLMAMAPSKLLSAEAKKRKKLLEKQLATESNSVKAAKKALAEEPAWGHFEELVKLAARDPWNQEVRARRPAAMREFEDAIAGDERWRPVLEHHQRLAARYIDSHKLVIDGLILGLAATSADYASFRDTVEGFGTAAFGAQRKQEYALGVGRFIDDPEAKAWLVDRARRWADRIDEWDMPVSPEFEAVLLRHPLPETFELINRVLSATQFHGGNWRICVKAAIAAGELGAKSCEATVDAALARGLGREDNGERASIRAAWKRSQTADA